jgi:hypothetical protein
VRAARRRLAAVAAGAVALVAGPTGPAPAQTPDCIYARCPVASTGDARDVTATAATLTGTVDPAGLPVAASFTFAGAGAGGATAPPAVIGAGATATLVQRRLTGLTPATTYRFRLVVDAEGLRVTGVERTFTTAAAVRPSAKRRPAAFTIAVRPRRDARRPFRFTVAGRLTRPKALRADRAACAGRVRVRLVQGRTVRGRRTASLRADCAFRAIVAARRVGGRRGRLTVSARFLGNARLRARSAEARTVRFGPPS